MHTEVVVRGKPYTFADYFRLNPDIEELLAYFGYSLEITKCQLPRTNRTLDRLEALRLRLEESLPNVGLTSEIARREFLIAPVLAELIHYTQAKIRVEYPLNISEQLQGTLDYFIRSKQNFLVVEAKNEDLQRGFTQLAVELIALSQWREEEQEEIFGAVSIGRVWQFGVLDCRAKRITQDTDLYQVPNDLEDLLRILVAILSGE